MENTKLYLKEVTLSGYKSIINVNISFKKGLNIIIGKNAAGKTNFLSFLNKVLGLNFEGLYNFESNIVLKNKEEYKIVNKYILNELSDLSGLNSDFRIVSNLYINHELVKYDEGDYKYDNKFFFFNNGILIEKTLIYHGIPNNYIIVDKSFSFKFYNTKLSPDLFQHINEFETPYFIKSILIDIAVMLKPKTFDEIIMRKRINEVLKNIDYLNEVLNKYSPINEIRFSNNFNIFANEESDYYTITNLFLEFKINNNWLPFSNLSDGTKRLFYIISEICEDYDNKNLRTTNIYNHFEETEKISRIILIGEPELGIHPHQFHQLMQFLKIEAENKQIIVTTHSPKALDILNKEELDRVIIASIENSKDGTKLNHLNKSQIEKANLYMKEDFLSDYWLYSDLEKR